MLLTSPGIWVGIAMAVLFVAVLLGVVMYVVTGGARGGARGGASRRGSRRQLRETFGPEYDRTVASHGGNRRRAEEELQARQARVEGFNLHPLAAADRTRFSQEWQAAQARFVDQPVAATAAADRLITDLLVVRGYPMHAFDERAADVSVHHPHVVAYYRQAHAISLASAQGQATTEELRAAMLYYRELFDDLLKESDTTRPESRERTEVG